MTHSASSMLQVLLLVVLFSLFGLFCGFGLDFCSADFREEGVSCGWNRYSPQQQGASSDVASIHRAPGIIVLSDGSAFHREACERPLGARVGQYFCIHLPIRARLGMPSNWTRRCGSFPSNLEIA